MKIGLALSGGAVRGIAHIGVLKYLEESNVNLCCIAGTSAGSIVGSLYCSGKSVDELQEVAESVSWKDLIKISWPRKGIIESKRLLKVVKHYLGDIQFEDLELPLLINAVDIIKGKEIIMKQGALAEAVTASCSIPGIFTPVESEGLMLVDGGLLNNIPASLLKDQDLDYIISVNVGAQSLLQKEPETLIEVLIQSFDVIKRQHDQNASDYADLVIEPDLSEFAFYDTSKGKFLIEKGYHAARKALENVDLSKKKGRISSLFGKDKK
ncbi:MAG: patatin-like phospholipase family protein [Bacillota bacterium]